MDRHCENARAVAVLLTEHRRVSHPGGCNPGLPSHPGQRTSPGRQRAATSAGMVCSTFAAGEDGDDQARAKGTRLFPRWPSFHRGGGALIEHGEDDGTVGRRARRFESTALVAVFGKV